MFFTGVAKNKTPLKKIGRISLLLIILLGVVETTGSIFYTIGLKDTSAINAEILSNSETIIAVLIGMTLLRERLRRNEMIPLCLIILGSVVLPIGYDLQANSVEISNFVYGDMMILLASLFYCLDTFIAKKISNKIHTARIVHLMSCTGAVLCLILVLLFQVPMFLDVYQLSIISIVGILGIGMTTIFFIMALRLIGTVRTVLIYSVGTVFGIVYSVLYLAEPLTLVNIASTALVMFGLYFIRNKLGED